MTTPSLEARIRRFARRLYDEDVNLHGFMLSVDGVEKAKAYCPPFREGQPHRMYSVSKTMTALAIGILAEDGKLGLDDAICDYFRDWLPEQPHEWLLALTIRDMLRMATCFPNATYREYVDENWARTFFEATPTHAPGTVFHYDTSCSQVLAALVWRLSGVQVIDFLNDRLFTSLGATDEKYWLRDPSGCCTGGTGLCMSLRDFHKVAQCLMDGGQGLVPEIFVREMGQKHIDTLMRDNPEERYGYGWQCWRHRAGWWMYGMGGQLAMICPDKRALLTTIADTRLDPYGVQRIQDAFFEEIYPYIGVEDCTPMVLELQARPLDNLCAAPLKEAGEYRFVPGNALGLKRLWLRDSCLHLENAHGEVELPFVPGKVIEIAWPGAPETPAQISAGWLEPGLLHLRCFAIGDFPCGFEMLVNFKGNTVTVQSRRSHDPLTEGYQGVATGTLA